MVRTTALALNFTSPMSGPLSWASENVTLRRPFFHGNPRSMTTRELFAMLTVICAGARVSGSSTSSSTDVGGGGGWPSGVRAPFTRSAILYAPGRANAARVNMTPMAIFEPLVPEAKLTILAAPASSRVSSGPDTYSTSTKSILSDPGDVG